MMPKKQEWTFEEKSSGVHLLRFRLKNPSSRFRSLHISDLHWDNPKCNRVLLKKHLTEAKRINAPIFVYGDLFCAMQGKFDRRHGKDDIRREHQRGDYLDSLVTTAADWFEPFMDQLVLITEGNHETAIKRFHETDLLDRLAYRLRDRGGLTQKGGYQGFVRHLLTIAKASRTSFDVFYHHGSGGGAPVTKGAIDFNRLSEQVEADVYISGHIHRLNHNRQLKMTVNGSGRQRLKEIDYVRTSTYKQEGDSSGGWAVEKRLGPRPLGGYWLECSTYQKDRINMVNRQWIQTV